MIAHGAVGAPAALSSRTSHEPRPGAVSDHRRRHRSCYIVRVTWEWSSLAPYAEQLGFGVVAGFAVGYALKKVGKVVAVVIGLMFVVVQVLASQGFLTVHWGEVQARVDPWFETETLDGAWRSLVGVLTHNLTFAGAFVPGLVVGLRRG
jgi:uncharacterized membrane protein (Fun14 family)